jgi:nitroreductase
MELLEALRPRKRIRAFKPEAVPQGLIIQVLESARWAPSWGNTQPWELLVVGGDPVTRLTAPGGGF